MHTRQKMFYSFFFFFRERNFYVLPVFRSDNYNFHWEKQLFFLWRNTSRIFDHVNHKLTEAKRTMPSAAIFRTQFSSHTTIESSHTTVESSHTTIESCWSTIESCWSTIEACRSTREQKYEENGRILHNLAFVYSKSIINEHGPAISVDCLDFSLK